MKSVLTILLCILSIIVKAQISVTGTLDINGTISYPTLKAAFDAVNAGTHKGVITMSVTGNTTETSTANLNASGTGASSYTHININPSGGGARSISGAIAAGSPLIDLNGADSINIDGLNSGGNSLTISNTTISATTGTSTLQFKNGATNNHVTRCSILGSATMSSGILGGNIVFGAASVLDGNDNNKIINCDIGPAGTNLPSKCIYFAGSSNNNPGTANSGISISDCRIFDFFSPTVNSFAIELTSGSVADTINNNKFYQTGTRTQSGTSIFHRIISISNPGGNGYVISNNQLGFANSSGTGSYAFAFPVSTANSFVPLFLEVSPTGVTKVFGNTIAGIAITGAASGTTTSAPFRAIHVNAGSTIIGGTVGNTIGSQSATGSITFSSSSSAAADIIGIYGTVSDHWTVSNNAIGGITVSNSSTGAASIYGVRCALTNADTFYCSNNLIGGTIANSLQSTSSAAGTIVNGVFVQSATGVIMNNTIQNLTASGGTGTGNSASVTGIVLNTQGSNHSILQNTIHSLKNLHATNATNITGIHFNSTTGANLVDRNLVHGLTVATTNVTSVIAGIRTNGGTCTYSNNMVAIGGGVSIACIINGIQEQNGTNNFYHNSVYVGGAPSTGIENSFAFNSVVITNTRSYRDNIFCNARSNSGATGKNYAVRVGGTTPNPAGLTINYNLYYANGVGGMFGQYNAADIADLNAWRTAVGQDVNSIYGDPQYNDPGNAIPDLHLDNVAPTWAEAAGTDVGLTQDFDGQNRVSLTPVDIGADAGNFINVNMAYVSSTTTQNNIAPVPNGTNQEVIGIRIVTSGFLNALVVTSFSLAINGTTLPADIANAKLFYTGSSNAFATNTQFGTTFASPNGAFAIAGSQPLLPDTNFFWLTYDVLATAISANVIDAGCFSITIGSARIPTDTEPAGSRVISPIRVTSTLGNNGPVLYSKLASAFSSINSGTHQGVITIELTGNSIETATCVLNGSGIGSAAYTKVSIQPTGGTAVVISGSLPLAPLIDLNGADSVVINGLNTGGNSLTLSNITAAPQGTTILFRTDATNNKITNCSVLGSVLAGNGVPGANITFAGSAITTGNDKNYITKCNIGPAGTNLPAKCFYFSGTSNSDPGTANSGIVIDSNMIYDCFSVNQPASAIDIETGNTNITISNNKFYQTAQRTQTTSSIFHGAIYINNPNGNHFQVINNTIGFANSSGTGLYAVSITSPFAPIYLNVGNADTTSVQGNIIAGISISGSSTGATFLAPFKGIHVVAGLVNIGTVNGNIIGSQSASGSISFTTLSTSAEVIGILYSSPSPCLLRNNLIGGITATALGQSPTAYVTGIRYASIGGLLTCQSNTIGGDINNSLLSATVFGGAVIGIAVSNGPSLISGNIVRNLTASGASGTNSFAGVIGISVLTSNYQHTTRNNTIHHIQNTFTGGNSVYGILFIVPSGANFLERNTIYSINNGSINIPSEIAGIVNFGGSVTIQNNMIAIGDGATKATTLYGIRDVGLPNTIFHNSIYIGGSPTTGSGNSYAFFSSVTGGPRSFRDNIFVNARSNNGATGKNYVINVAGSTPNPPGLTINNNIYYSTGAGSVFGFYNMTDVLSLTSWQFVVGQDIGSFQANPFYNDPTNSVPDLHIHPTNPSPAEGTGADVGVTNDLDGQIRASLSPVDIGADAGIFVQAPSMTYVSSTTTQNNTTSVAVGAMKQEIIGIQVVTTGILNPLIAFGFYLNTSGTTALTDIANARMYCTGSSPLFNTSQPYGPTIGNPGTVFFINGYQPLTSGTNYFWLTYDIPLTAQGNHFIDAQCDSIFVGSVHVPTVQSPAGSRLIAPIAVTATAGTIGPTPYQTLKSAFDAVNAGVHRTNITIKVYGNTTETATAILNASGTGAALYSNMLIIPIGVPRIISGSIPAGNQLVKFNGADNVVINGDFGGSNFLTFSNSTISNVTGSSTIQFVGDAINNTIRYCNILGSSTVEFGEEGGNLCVGSSVATGNDNLLIYKCDFGPAGTNLPTKCIFLGGTSNVNPGAANSGIIIDNNKIHDFFSSTSTSAGIEIWSGTVGTLVSNNKLYQTATRTQTGLGISHRPISIINEHGNGYTLSYNTIGFANESGTGTYNFVFPATSNNSFTPIYMFVDSMSLSNVSNNLIDGINVTGAAYGLLGAAPLRCISIEGGLVALMNNYIGSYTQNDRIVMTTSASLVADVIGILYSGINDFTSNGNVIGGLTVNNTGTGAANVLALLCVPTVTKNWICMANTIGGEIPNSIKSLSTSVSTAVSGIRLSNCSATIEGNIIRNLSASGGTGSGFGSSVVGIRINSSNGTRTISQNILYGFSNSHPTATTYVTGIQLGSGTSNGSNLVKGNKIYGISAATSSNTAAVAGIRMFGGSNALENNMVVMGMDNVNGCTVLGMAEDGGTNTVFHNSVYVNGAPLTGNGNSFAFQSTVTTTTRSYRDNIFVNARSNNGATGKHYAISVGGTAPNPPGLAINNNLYHVQGNGSVFGLFNNADVNDLADWQTAVGQDAASYEANPNFLDPENAAPDLHLNPMYSSLAEGNGADVGVMEDKDGEDRSFFSPVDIGADAGDYSACTLMVSNTGDIGPGSLRDVISCVQPGATITFAPSLTNQTISLTSEIEIDKDLTLSGPGMLNLTISGSTITRIFHVRPGFMLELQGMSLKDAETTSNGGAVYIQGMLKLEEVLLQNNKENALPKALTLGVGANLVVEGNVEIKY